MSEDFSDIPVSLAEVRADREYSARAWTARDVLVSMLRDIDSGAIRVDACCVAFSVVDEQGEHERTGFRASYRDVPFMLGVLGRVQYQLNQE